MRASYDGQVVVLEKEPSTLLVALFVRGFWLEVTADEQGRTKARYLYGAKQLLQLSVGIA